MIGRDPRLPRRLADAAEPGHEMEAEIAVLKNAIRRSAQRAADREAEVIDGVIEAVTDAQREAAERERAARRERLRKAGILPPGR